MEDCPSQRWPTVLESKPRQKSPRRGFRAVEFAIWALVHQTILSWRTPGRAIHQPGQPPGGASPPSVVVLTTEVWGSGTAATIETLKTRQIAVARRVRREVNMVLDGVGVGVGCRYVLCELLRARGCQSGCDDSLQGKIGGSTRAYERRTRPLTYGVTKDVKETGKV